MINSRFEALFGIQNEKIHNKTDYDIFPKDTAEQFRKNDLKVLTNGDSSQVAEQIPHNDGVHTYLSVKFPVYDEAGGISGVCGISTDVTALKKAQDQLRRLSASIIESQEHERTAIARELHDQLGQVLTALRMDAVWISEHFKGKDLKASKRVLSMRSLIDDTIEEVRNMALRLRPGVLDTLGLVDALEWLAVDFERRTGISCVFEHREIPSIDGALATTSYRIAQESLTNVTRHADASRVEVKLNREESILVLSITDDGRGFDKAIMSESRGLGVPGMRERAGLVGGILEIHSEPEKGTEVHFKAPIDAKDYSTGSKGKESIEKPSPLQF
jgi:PAS domain S-box-containing protein